MFESDLIGYLSAQIDTIAFTPGHIQERINPYPAIVWLVISHIPVHQLNTLGYVIRSHVQFSIFSHSYSDLVTYAAALRDALNGYTGTMGSTYVLGAIEQNITDNYEAAENSTDLGVYSKHIEYEVIYQA